MNTKSKAVLKVGEFIKFLKDFPKDYYVIISKDSEGNEMSSIYGIEIVSYNFDTDRYDYSAESVLSDNEPNAIVIYPIH